MARQAIRAREPRDAGNELPAGLHPVVRRVLLARGVSRAGELHLGLDRLQPPDALTGLHRAGELLARAVMDGARITVVGDFDADGATGAAVAVLALRAMGAAHADFCVPNRFEFGYGLSVPLVDSLAAFPPDVLVTVDAGINCVAGVRRARELGWEVIVTDHHLPGEVLPAASAIVNPNLRGDPFPSKALAGVGVMFYLLIRVRLLLRESGWFGGRRPAPNLAGLLDLVALGTVADLVPLDYNNRILVRQGLDRIRQGQARPGLMALLRVANRDYRQARAADLGFAVGPRLNAAGRLEDMGVGIRCLLADERAEADRLAATLDELNRQRRDLQEQMQAEAMEQVRALIAGLAQALPNSVCLFDSGWHQGVIGLVASRVKDALHRPVVAFAPAAEGSDRLKGSARSVRGLHIRDVLARVDALAPGMIDAFGGHAMAAGLTLPAASFERFRELFDRAVLEVLDGDRFDAELLTDGELEPASIGLPLALELEALEPWGQRFPEPVFDGRFVIADQRVVGGTHLRLTVRPAGAAERIPAVAFNTAPEELPGQATVRLLYRLEVNRWRGTETCQLVVERVVG